MKLTHHMPVAHLAFAAVALICAVAWGAGSLSAAPAKLLDLDALFGPEVSNEELLTYVEPPAESDAPAPAAPLVLPATLNPVLSAPAFGGPAIPEKQLRAVVEVALRAAALKTVIVTDTGLVLLVPPVMPGAALPSIERWLRIFREAGIVMIPTQVHGTPLWVEWMRLTRIDTNDKESDARWVRFYRNPEFS
ncbi:hypothetical protein [Geminisphaera colitermitum]|uniref:hypothetical protein n=1 Tax=Geminisphaera colitermitum TaxID=1148786 RepID=UPI000158C9B0|nr:hypothetical protein [Geminisphaera colitermitum]